MRGFVLLVGALAALAPELTAVQKLQGVEKGLQAILKNSASLEDLVKPMVAEVDAAVASKKEEECTKVLKKFPEWRKQMTKRQTELTSAGDSERTALLVSVLQNRQSDSVDDQMGVVESADFQGLPVVDFIEQNSNGKTALVTLALQYLDSQESSNSTEAKVVRKAEVAADANATDAKADPLGLSAIIAQLEKHEHRAEAQVAALSGREKKLQALFAGANKKKAGEGLNTPAGKFLERKELRKVEKRLATEETTAKALKKAVTDIEHKDLKGLQEAKDALTASMNAMIAEQQAGQGDFLHFLQTGSSVRQPTGSFSCPYCGAQCVEKCRSTEHKSYSACLTECIALNPVEGK